MGEEDDDMDIYFKEEKEEEELLQEAMEAGKEMRSVNNKKWKKFRPPTVQYHISAGTFYTLQSTD